MYALDALVEILQSYREHLIHILVGVVHDKHAEVGITQHVVFHEVAEEVEHGVALVVGRRISLEVAGGLECPPIGKRKQGAMQAFSREVGSANH